jgi:hypothetical protein
MASNPAPRQGHLFDVSGTSTSDPIVEPLPLLEHQLRAWQERLHTFQAPRFKAVACGAAINSGQIDLFRDNGPGSATSVQHLNPLALAARNLQFWRWPESQGQGAALYFVIDQPAHLEGSLLLYVGETGQADRRWKGDHDCKSYLAAYGEALQQAGLGSSLSIRFWRDAPAQVRPRRALEQALIRHWLPPFNKETRSRWATPFTADQE